MAAKELPPPGLLASFANPLWERVRLDDPQPLWIVRSTHRGYPWMAIELQHSSVGLFSDSSAKHDSTTVFVLELPEKSPGRHLPASRIAPHRQVSVDEGCLYLASFGESPRVRDWPRWLDMAADAADEVVQNRGRTTPPAAKEEDNASWNPHDGQWALFWMLITVPMALLLAQLVASFYQEWAATGAITHCNTATHRGYALQGWKAMAYLGVMLIPFAGWGAMLHAIATRLHRPGFVLRLNLLGAALVASSGLALLVQQTLTGWARTSC